MRLALAIFAALWLPVLLGSCVPIPEAGLRAEPTSVSFSPTPIPLSTRTPLSEEATAVMTASPPRTYATYTSPDGQWRIEIVIHDCVQTGSESETKAYEALKLIQTSDGREMLVQDQLRYCGGLGAFGLDGLNWSPDGRYFFFTDAREGVPDGAPPDAAPWKPPIYRLDVTQQRVEPFSGSQTR
jgi:hypothetical protein